MLPVGEHEVLIGIDDQAPVAEGVATQQEIPPHCAAVGPSVGRLGPPERHVLLLGEILEGTVGGSVVDDEEPIDAETAMMSQHMG